MSEYLQLPVESIEIGAGTIDILERLLSLFETKTITCIGPYWSGIRWACYKNSLKFDEVMGDIAYVAFPNSRDGLLREINFDHYEYVIVDEAYGDFSDQSHFYEGRENVIVTKTFSKSLSMPGLRFAYCTAHPSYIDALKSESHRYSINTAVQSILPGAFDLIIPHVQRMMVTKAYLENKHDCLPSYANFVRTKEKPPYNVDVQKIDDFYRFTLVDMDTLDSLKQV